MVCPDLIMLEYLILLSSLGSLHSLPPPGPWWSPGPGGRRHQEVSRVEIVNLQGGQYISVRDLQKNTVIGGHFWGYWMP